MTVKKSMEYGSLFMFLLFVSLIVVIFYNYLTTPTFKPLPFLVVVFWLLINSLMNDFGEYLGRFIKKKNFITEGGMPAVYHGHINYPNGMSEYFFSTQKRYADYIGYDDFQEKGVIQRFFTRLSNSRVCSIIDHSYQFDEVPDYASDTPEGAILYRGTFRKGVKVLTPVEALQLKLKNAYAVISEFATVAEKAKAISEQTAQAQSKDLVESVIKVSTAMQNLPMQGSPYRQQQQQAGGNY